MPPAAGVASPSERAAKMIPTTVQQAPTMVSEAFAKDAIIAWFRGEFAAANAIIDALCNHLMQLEEEHRGRSEYESVFAAIHRRRLNWIPILQMQKYHSIGDVAVELRRVAAAKKGEDRVEGGEVKRGDRQRVEGLENEEESSRADCEAESMESKGSGGGGGEVVDEESRGDDSSEREITVSQEVHPSFGNVDLCSDNEECEAHRAQIKITKGFHAKEYVNGHTVNVVKGLKLFEDVFTGSELSKVNDFVNRLRVAGRNGELSGETYILYNQPMKGKRELIQLGAPIFGQIKEEANPKDGNNHIEPIPTLLQAVIDHLVKWHLISEIRKPNSCIINFFDEGEFSQPFMKPPHLEQPIYTLLLSESMMAFGRTLVNDSDGNYKGPLMLSLKEGSLLVLRGNSSYMARHVICPSPNKRVSITFFKVRSETNQITSSTTPPLSRAMTLWQTGLPTTYAIPNGALNGYEATNLMPKWGMLRAPMVMLAPMHPIILSPRRVPHTGTGVFLPWTVGSRKSPKHIPPRAQKAKLLLTLPPSVEAHTADLSSDVSIGNDAKMV